MSFESPRVTVNSSPQRGTISIHVPGHDMVEMTPFDAEDLGRKLIDNANDCITHAAYVSADETLRNGDPCPRCQSMSTRAMHHQDEPILVCSTCGHGT